MGHGVMNRTSLAIALVILGAALSGCAGWMQGYTKRQAFQRYMLVDAATKSFGYKRLTYSQGFYSLIREYTLVHGLPSFIYEFKTEDKKDGLCLYYVREDTVYVFVKLGWLPDTLHLQEQRHLTDYEKATYQELLRVRNAQPDRQAVRPNTSAEPAARAVSLWSPLDSLFARSVSPARLPRLWLTSVHQTASCGSADHTV
jgi:hypothetical protein